MKPPRELSGERTADSDYSPQWAELRKRRRYYLWSLLSLFLIDLGATSGFSFLAETLAPSLAPLWFVISAAAVLGWFLACIVCFLRFVWWRCPRCGQPFFGWWLNTEGRWLRIVSCNTCGLHSDAPHADSCRDRRPAAGSKLTPR
jgi:hypothetical protein